MRLGIILIIAAGTLAACGAPEPAATVPASAGKVPVVASFYPLEFLAARVGGDRVEVKTLVKPGVEPHDWEPTPGDIVAVRSAKVFVYQGAGLEEWAERVVRDLPRNGPLVLQASGGLETRPATPVGGSPDEGGRVGTDPHLWLDPFIFGREAAAVADALTQADPPGREAYAQNLARLNMDLLALAGEMDTGLKDCERRSIVTSHAAFGYLAARFNLEQIGVSGVSPEEEPSPARMRALIDLVRAKGVTHVFFEALVSPAVSETLAKEAGVGTLVLDPIEGPTDGKDYLALMRQNLANLRTALGCR